MQTLVAAVILVTLVVYLFLQSWRRRSFLCDCTSVVAGNLHLFPLLGFTINTLSLFGLVLAIGLVVDDAIVVVEAVQRNIDQGLSPQRRPKAMAEVSGPVVAIALILASVFIPVAFVPGITGRLYHSSL